MSLFELPPFFYYYFLTIIFIMGLCIGSFANVVILRAFSGESIVLPPSKCPHCHNRLKWYHNIPVLSYLFLRGKCGFCKKKISIQYPIVELIVGILFVLMFLKFDISLKAIFLAVACVLFVVMAVTDIKEQVIFDVHAYVLAGLGLIYNFFDIGHSGLGVFTISGIPVYKSFVFAILGLVCGAVIMELLAFVGKLLVGQRAFGEGDSFIIGSIGALFGLYSLPFIFIASFIIQVISVFPQFIKKIIQNKEITLMVSLSVFVVAVIIFQILGAMGLFNNILLNASILLIMLISAFLACKSLIVSCRKKDASSLTYVAFGPALILASILYLFLYV